MQSELNPGTKGNLQHTGNKAVSYAANDAITEAAEEVNPFSEEEIDAMKAALRPKDTQQGQVKQQRRSFWGVITDYITGADKLQQAKS
jgi:hypothetical protein